MNYSDTLRAAQHSFPSLFPYEHDFLVHAFFVIGNGYKWENGEIVSLQKFASADEEIEHWRSERIQLIQSRIDREEGATGSEFRKSYQHERLALAQSPIEDQWAAEIKYRRDLIKELHWSVVQVWFETTLYGKPVIGKTTEVSDYSLILKMPADVKPDWLNAAKNLIELVRHGVVRIDAVSQDYLMKAINLIRTIEGE